MDLRKVRSQEKLQAALAEHLQNKTIDEITIGELTRTAGVSRQTFYSNFDSKQSILLNRIETLFGRAKANFESLVNSRTHGRVEVLSLGLKHMLDECERERTVMRAAFTGQAGIQCLTLLKTQISGLIAERTLTQFGHNFESNQLDYFAEFYAGALIGVIQGWLLDESGSKTTEEVASQIATLILHGLDSFIPKPPLNLVAI